MDMNIQQKILDAVLSKPENKTCADSHKSQDCIFFHKHIFIINDCDMKNPKWASTSFGIFICLRCSGMHRQLQVHITKVKSVTLDKWQPEVVEMYKHLNNSIANSYWEAKLPGSHAKLNIDSKPAEVESFIIDKYINKRWVDLSSQIGRNGLDPAKLYQQNRKEYDQYVRELFGHSNTQIHQNISPQSQNVLLNQRGNSNSSQIKRQMQEMAVSQDQPQDFNIQSLQQQVNQQSNQTKVKNLEIERILIQQKLLDDFLNNDFFINLKSNQIITQKIFKINYYIQIGRFYNPQFTQAKYFKFSILSKQKKYLRISIIYFSVYFFTFMTKKLQTLFQQQCNQIYLISFFLYFLFSSFRYLFFSLFNKIISIQNNHP